MPSSSAVAAPTDSATARANAGPARVEDLLHAFTQVRNFSKQLSGPLEPEDCVVQTMPDVSPTKWHLAHTSWFFDTFLLRPHARDVPPLASEYAYLFNSYYNAAGPMHCRDRRGFITRPTLAETFSYRRHVDEHVAQLLRTANAAELAIIAPLVVLGINHEQQHQELLLTDIKHVFAQNPLRPAYHKTSLPAAPAIGPLQWLDFDEGLRWIGADADAGFVFDNERPRHREFLESYALADRLVSNAEYAAFIAAGGYERPDWWLSLGWATVQDQHWSAPLYWERERGTDRWLEFTLHGRRPLDPAAPVCHVSYFEADAYARWAGVRLPTEAEWEHAAGTVPLTGAFVEQGRFHPTAAAAETGAARPRLRQMFGDVWEWTRSPYTPYPGYAPASGALGEYNGKFMCNQMILRGGSCATSASHIRRTYRNFFGPDKRWQFAGIRLARDRS